MTKDREISAVENGEVQRRFHRPEPV